MDKICPLMSMQYNNIGECPEFIYCQKEQCAWWTKILTTDHIPTETCSIEALTKKNADGLYRKV